MTLPTIYTAGRGCGEEAQDVKARRMWSLSMELIFIITNSNQINVRKNKPKTFYFHPNKDDF